LNTGEGFINVIENLLNWRVWNLPAVLPGQCPLVHAHALAHAIARSLRYSHPSVCCHSKLPKKR
jgi:hypothetical protein